MTGDCGLSSDVMPTAYYVHCRIGFDNLPHNFEIITIPDGKALVNAKRYQIPISLKHSFDLALLAS